MTRNSFSVLKPRLKLNGIFKSLQTLNSVYLLKRKIVISFFFYLRSSVLKLRKDEYGKRLAGKSNPIDLMCIYSYLFQLKSNIRL